VEAADQGTEGLGYVYLHLSFLFRLLTSTIQNWGCDKCNFTPSNKRLCADCCLGKRCLDVRCLHSDGPFHLHQMHGISESAMDLGAFDVDKPVTHSIQLT
jgi:hypothetical protein